MNFPCVFPKDFIYFPLFLFLVMIFKKNLFLQSLRHSGEQNILTDACNIKLKCPENLGLNSFDCVKKSNVKCFLQLRCSQRFREYRKYSKYYHLDYRYNILWKWWYGLCIAVMIHFLLWSIYNLVDFFRYKDYKNKIFFHETIF